MKILFGTDAFSTFFSIQNNCVKLSIKILLLEQNQRKYDFFRYVSRKCRFRDIKSKCHALGQRIIIFTEFYGEAVFVLFFIFFFLLKMIH